MTYEENLKRLEDIKNLEEDWDGYGAGKIDAKVRIKAFVALNEIDLDNQPSIYPVARNSIQFEWELENGAYFEAEFFSYKTTFLWVPPSKGEEKRGYSEAKEGVLLSSRFTPSYIGKHTNALAGLFVKNEGQINDMVRMLLLID